MLKNNLRLELETIHHDPRRQAGGMTKDSSANRPPKQNMERPWCFICQVHSGESENAQRSALLAAIYFSSKMRYYITEKCNWSELAERNGRNEWHSLWNAYLEQCLANSQSQWLMLLCWLHVFNTLYSGAAGWIHVGEGRMSCQCPDLTLGWQKFRTIAPLAPRNEVSVLR